MSWHRILTILIVSSAGGDALALCPDGPGPDVTAAVAATAKDAPCTTWGEPEAKGQVVERSLRELSGVAVSRSKKGVLWVQNDGRRQHIYAIDTEGNTIATVDLGEDVLKRKMDVEDIAIGPCGPGSSENCIYLADTGDNPLNRKSVRIIRFPEPSLRGATSRRPKTITVQPDVFKIRYPDEDDPDKTKKYDAEAMAVTPTGGIVILTKDEHGDRSKSRVMFIPELDAALANTDKRTIARQIGKIYPAPKANGNGVHEDWKARVTGADMTPDGSVLLVRTRDFASKFPVSPLLANAGETRPVKDILIDPSPDQRIPVAGGESNGEAIAFDPYNGGYWTIAEGRKPIIYFYPCISD